MGPKPCSLQGAEYHKTWIWNKISIRKIPAMNSGAGSLPQSNMHVSGMGSVQLDDPSTAPICGYQLPLSLPWKVPCHKAWRMCPCDRCQGLAQRPLSTAQLSPWCLGKVLEPPQDPYGAVLLTEAKWRRREGTHANTTTQQLRVLCSALKLCVRLMSKEVLLSL